MALGLKDMTLIKKRNFFKRFFRDYSNRFYSNFYEIDKLVIDMNYRNYQKVLETRNESLKSFRASEDMHKWVIANLNF